MGNLERETSFRFNERPHRADLMNECVEEGWRRSWWVAWPPRALPTNGWWSDGDARVRVWWLMTARQHHRWFADRLVSLRRPRSPFSRSAPFPLPLFATLSTCDIRSLSRALNASIVIVKVACCAILAPGLYLLINYCSSHSPYLLFFNQLALSSSITRTWRCG